VVLSGPPIYLKALEDDEKSYAREQLIRLAERIPTVVVDHHLTRDPQYVDYIEPIAEVAQKQGHVIQTAAEFMGQPNHLLEAYRVELYDKFPVDEDWHQGLMDKDPDVLKDLDRWEAELNHLEQYP
jgi:predicted metallo-beta-lactamase superfamily hydrolase